MTKILAALAILGLTAVLLAVAFTALDSARQPWVLRVEIVSVPEIKFIERN